MLEAEIEEHWDYAKNSVTGNIHNVYDRKRIICDYVFFEITVPRDRNNVFIEKLLKMSKMYRLN